jgi:predicted phage-related endonuclease
MKPLMSADEVAARPEQWLTVKRSGITSTDIAGIMRVPDAFAGAAKIYYEKTDPDPDPPDTLSMAIGRHFEAFVADWFTGTFPDLELRPGGLYAADDPPWAMATFDRLAYTRDGELAGPVECKTSDTYDGYGPDGSDEIPERYVAQDIWEMFIAGTDRVWMPVLFTHTRKIRCYLIRRDADADADITAMLEQGEAFLRRVARRDPPPVDWRPETAAALKRVYARVIDVDVVIPDGLARRLRAAHRGTSRYKRIRGQADNELRARMGAATRAVTADGQLVAARTVYPRGAYKVEATTIDRITIKGD